MQTACPIKLFLKIPIPLIEISFMMVKKLCRESGVIQLLSRGKAIFEAEIEGLSVFLYRFTNTTCCSSASQAAVPRVKHGSSWSNFPIVANPHELGYGLSFFFHG